MSNLIYSNSSIVEAPQIENNSGNNYVLQAHNRFIVKLSFNIAGTTGASVPNTHILDMRTSNTSGYQPVYIDQEKMQFHIADLNLSIDWEYNFKCGTDYTICIIVTTGQISAYVNGEKLVNPSNAWPNVDRPTVMLPTGSWPIYIGRRFEPISSTLNEINGQIWGIEIYTDKTISYLTKDHAWHNIAFTENKDTSVSALKLSELSSDNIVENSYKYIDLGNTGEDSANYLEVNGDKYFDTGIAIEADTEYWLEYELEYLHIESTSSKTFYNQIMGITGNRGLGIGTAGEHIWESDNILKLKAGKPYFHRWYLNTGTGDFYREVAGIRTYGRTTSSIDQAINQAITFKFFGAIKSTVNSSDDANATNTVGYGSNCRLHNKIKLTKKVCDELSINEYSIKYLINTDNWYNISDRTKLSGNHLKYGEYAKYLNVLHHDVSKNRADASLYFDNEEEAKRCYKLNKFSRLGDLASDKFKSIANSKYEFLLNYPQPLTYYQAGVNKDTGIIIDWNKAFYLDLNIEILEETKSERRLIIGNYSETNDNHFSLELTSTSQNEAENIASRLRVYMNRDLAFSSKDKPLSPGLWNIQVFYNPATKIISVCASSDAGAHRLSVQVEPAEGEVTSLMIGAADRREEQSPFKAIKVALNKTNSWRQSISPLDPYGTAGNRGYEEISIGMHNGAMWAEGLCKETNYNSTVTLLESAGVETSNVHGALGVIGSWGGQNGSGFPAPDGSYGTEVELWVRIDNTQYDTYSAILKDAVYVNNFTEGVDSWLN